MIDTKSLTITEAHTRLMNGEFTSVDLCQACVAVVNEKNSELHALLEVFSDWEEQAKKADEMIKNGRATTLTGIPIVLKDNILFFGHHASAGSKILEPYVASYSATVVEKLRTAGAVILGRANMDEFAMGSSTENSAYGVTKNPYDTSRVAGGSSGGSVASVATGMALGALGTDTGGSIRQPAGFCGVAGFKSSYGYTSRYGAIAMGNSLDQIGPIAKTVQDIEVLQSCIGGYDKKDATSIASPVVENKQVKTIGVPWGEIEREGIDAGTLARFKESIETLKKAGYEIKDITLPKMKYSLAVYYILMPAEVSTNLSRFDGIRYGLSVPADTLYDVYAKTKAVGFGPETRRRVMLGAYVLSHGYYDAYYRKALLVRDAIVKEFEEIFTTVDVIATPTSPASAFLIGEKSKDPLAMYLSDIFTVPANIAGIPAISIPNGFDSKGLPLDIQFMSAFGKDTTLFSIGKAFEDLRK